MYSRIRERINQNKKRNGYFFAENKKKKTHEEDHTLRKTENETE